jgi:peptide/nickel transport system ATP-binding protein
MPEPVLEVRDLQTHFATNQGVVRAVDGVSFSVDEGEVLGLVGESGSGKSATGFSILGLLDPPGRVVGGSIRFKGRELVDLGQAEMRKLRGNRIAMIFQDPMTTLNPSMRIGDQMIEALRAHARINRSAALARARDCLTRVGVTAVNERLESYPHQLSGGLRQRVVIATALLNEPDVIIADEPTTALDVTIQAQILHEVQALCAQTRMALIWITHDLSVVAGLANKICVMYAGRDVEQGPVGQVLDCPRHPYTSMLLASAPSATSRGQRLPQSIGGAPSSSSQGDGCTFAPRCTCRRSDCAIAPERTVIADSALRCHFPLSDRSTPLPLGAAPPLGRTAIERLPILSVKSVSKVYEGNNSLRRELARLRLVAPPPPLKAVTDVSFEIRPGEIVGLVGESGCGKSTLGRMIAGITTLTSGRIFFEGRPLSTLSKPKKTLADLPLQMIFQNPFASLNPRMKVKHIIGAAAQMNGLVPRKEIDDHVDHLMLRCGLDPALKERYPHQFSGGQRQRIGIARALAVRPRFLVCDESVSALDVSIQAQIINLFLDLRDEFGLTYLFISHDLGLVERICDRVIVMYLGRVVEEAPADVLFDEPLHPYSRALCEETPKLSERGVSYRPVVGEIPSPLDPPDGCAFHPRCPEATDICRSVPPMLKSSGHERTVSCHHRSGVLPVEATSAGK